MNVKALKILIALVIGLGLVSSRMLWAQTSEQFADAQKVIVGVPPPEIPIHAANFILQAGDHEKESATTNMVQAVVEMNPATLPSVMAQIARTTPAVAALAAATAATLQSNDVYLITLATAGAAPDRVSEIVSAIVNQLPNQYIVVAGAAAQVVPPSADTNILNAVSSAIPVLKPYIDKLSAHAGAADGSLPIVAILNQSTLMALHDQSAAPAPVSPSASTPPSTVSPSTNGVFSPKPATATNNNPDQTSSGKQTGH